MRRAPKWADERLLFAAGCMLSMLLCSILSTRLADAVTLNMGIVPASLVILYGGRRLGICAAFLHFAVSVLFLPVKGLLPILFDTGVLAYPLLFALRSKFVGGTLTEKIGISCITAFPAALTLALTPILTGELYTGVDVSEVLAVLMLLCMIVFLGALLIYWIEAIRETQRSKLGMEGMSMRLELEADKLQQITRVIPLSIMSFNGEGTVTGLNDPMLKTIQSHFPYMKRDDFVGRPVQGLLEGGLLAYSPISEGVLRKRRVIEKIAYGAKIYHCFTAPLLENSGDGTSEVILVLQDMTEEEKIRTELDHVERLTLVGQMAAGITHEIRNPMAVIRGFLQLMREKSPSELGSYYQIVLEELDRANGIITDFLSLAQSRVSEKEELTLDAVIEEVCPLLWADANLRGQSVEVKLGRDQVPLRLNVREIKQVVLNLGRNAMEAMETKGVLTLETRQAGERVELLVKDTGAGMPAEVKEKLFMPFYTTKPQGTGLGLSLCLSIIERHGGMIHVDSAVGEGTVFTISFPAARQPAASGLLFPYGSSAAWGNAQGERSV